MKTVVVLWLATVLFNIAVLGAVTYVAWHFIAKFW